MIRDFIKWVVPGLATVLGGATLCLAMATPANAQATIDTRAPSGSITVLEAPQIADYWMSATRQPGGVVVFDGYAPDEATREAFSQNAGADTTWLKLGRGAPETYRTGADFGLAALTLMGEGRIALRGNALSITGTASSSADYATLQAILTASPPQGVTLANIDIKPPRADTYNWSATKDSTGAVKLSGLVPNPDDAASLLAAAGPSSTQTMAYASGEPNGFNISAQTGLELLHRLSDGSVIYDGHGWTVAGTAKTAADKVAIDTDFVVRHLAASGWSMAVAAPIAGVAAVTPVAAPQPVAVDPDYAFSASRSANGAVILSGQVPAGPGLRALGAISNGDIEAVSTAEGAPDGFLANAETGLRALAQLSQGRLDFAQGHWSLSGIAADAAGREALLAALDATWTASIDLPPPAPEPEPVAMPTPVAPVDITACAAPVADFSARNAILFRSGAAIITAESDPALDELATDLLACPDAVVHIEGHTDADGDDALNLALSVARAEAVVDALIARGVAPARLYAVGYGEAMPVADNGTAQGKQLNRRIVVTVRPEHF